jgi:hypothetical protein
MDTLLKSFFVALLLAQVLAYNVQSNNPLTRRALSRTRMFNADPTVDTVGKEKNIAYMSITIPGDETQKALNKACELFKGVKIIRGGKARSQSYYGAARSQSNYGAITKQLLRDHKQLRREHKAIAMRLRSDYYQRPQSDKKATVNAILKRLHSDHAAIAQR